MHPFRRKSFIYLAATAIGLAAVSIAASKMFFTAYTWSGPAGGNWNAGSNWTPIGVPNTPGDTASIPGGSLVNLDISPNVASVDNDGTLNLAGQTLTLNDPLGLSNGSIVRANSGTATVAGNITNEASGQLIANTNCTLVLNAPAFTNNGNVLVNHTGGFDSTLRFGVDSHVSGNGTIHLNGDNDGDRIETVNGATLFNEGNHVIFGRGTIAALLNNSATVNATVSGTTLRLAEQNVTNTGFLKASGGGILRINGITVNNAGGTVLGDGGDVHLDGNSVLSGGTIDRTGTSAVRGTGPTTLNNVTIAGTGLYVVNTNTTTNLSGTSLTNNGQLIINHSGGFDSALVALDNLSFLGNGSVFINGDNASDQLATDTGKTLTNTTNHTIRGRGSIPAQLVNQGTVQADVSGGNLDITTNAKINTGLMQATSGGILRFIGSSINNAGGTIRNNGGTVQTSGGVAITGGTFDGLITATGNTTLSDVFVASTGHYTINNGTSTTVLGNTLLNDGLITVNTTGGFDANIMFGSNVALNGTGLLRMNGDNTADFIDTGAGFVLTQANTHSMKGRGAIRAELVNHGVVEADITNWELELNSKIKHNPGVMRATNGGILRFHAVEVDNGGRIDAMGGNVAFSGATKIAGGNLSSTGAFRLMGEGAITLLNTTLDAGSEYQVRTNHATTLEGSFFTNNGVVLVNHSGGFDSDLIVNSNVTVGGSGHIEMNGDSDGDTLDTNGSFVLTNAAGHKIHGRGVLNGDIVNNGRIEADVNGWSLRLYDKAKKNANLYKALNGGTLLIRTAIDNTNGTIEANGGTVQYGNGAAITQGILTGPSNHDGVGSASLADLIIDDNTLYRVMTNTTTTLTGSTITNNGTILVNHTGGFDSVLSIGGDVQLLGDGDVNINGDTVADRIETTTGSKLTIGEDQLIHGRGRMLGEFENKGTIRADVNGWWLILTGAEDGFLNSGLIEPTNGARIDITDGTLFENAGDVHIPESQLLRVMTNNYRQTAGMTRVFGTMQILNGDLFLEGGKLMGTGTVTGDVDNATGDVSPGASAGTLTIQGTYSQSPTGKMTVEVADETSADKLVVSGACTLNGTMDIVLLDNFVPANGAEYEIISAGTLSGNFNKVQLGKLPDDISAELIVNGNKVILKFHTSAGTVVNPTSYSVTDTLATAPVNNLFASDNTYVVLGPAGITPSSITVTGTAPAMTVNWLEVVVEYAVSAKTLPEKVELFDYVNNAWVEVDSHVADVNDQRVRLAVALNPARFIHSTSREMQIRISNTPGMTSPKGTKRQVRYDQIIWRLR